MNKILVVLVMCCVFQVEGNAQDKKYELPASSIIQAVHHGESEAVRDWDYTKQFDDPREKPEKIGYHPKGDWPLHESVNPNALPQGEDPAWQKEKPLHIVAPTKAIDVNQDGIGYTGVNPSDNILDVGPNHVIQMVNASSGAQFTILDKAGNELAAPVYFDNFFGFSGGLGDPVVLYDALADRWFMAEFTSGSNDFNIAVSTSADPLGTYNTYTFTADNFPDYLKFGVWSDMYIMTSNESGPSPVYALDRTNMLAGNPASMQRFAVPDYPTIGFQATTPVTFDVGTAPPAGAPGMFMRMADDAWSASIPNDRLEIWSMDIDFDTPANSVVSGPDFMAVDPFDTDLCGYTSFACFQQPGTGTRLDPLREVLMNRVQYKNFGTHEAIVCNHVTDVDGTDRGGVRWYELRRNGGIANPWAVYQQGTYSPDSDNRFMAGIAINEIGDISLFYNVTSSSTFPGVRYTGRLAGDPLGQMTIAETSIVEGTASNASNRYGDYNSLDVDPSDGITFWGTSNYNPSTSWATRIAGYSFSTLNCTAPQITTELDEDCGAGTFSILVGIGPEGDASSYTMTTFGSDTIVMTGLTTGSYVTGPFAIGEVITVLVEHDDDPACNTSVAGLTLDGTSCCTAPTVDVTTTPDCVVGTFSVSLNIGADGDASDYDVYTINGPIETFIGTFADGAVTLGTYALGNVVGVRIEHNGFSFCNQTLTGITENAICNDDCDGAIGIDCGDVIAGTTIGATAESPDPGQCGTSPGTGGGVWYSFTGANSGSAGAAAGSIGDEVTISVCNDADATGGNADYDSKLRVFSGSCAALTCVTGVDDVDGCTGFSSIVTFTTLVGEEYYILVHGFSESEGNFNLSMDCISPPACAEPISLNATTTASEATLSWTEAGSSISWDVEYGSAGFTQGSGTVLPGLTSTTLVIPGLDSDTSYDFYVRSNCPNGVDNSEWVQGSFSTEVDYCSGDSFTDSGGSSGVYQNNELITYTICPDAGGNVSLTFTFVDIEVNANANGAQDGCWDFLTIYNGASSTDAVLAATLCGELDGDGGVPSNSTSLLQAGDVFTSTDASGCLTIVFDSDGSVTDEGWIATVDCGATVEPCDVFDTAPVGLTKSFQPVPFPNGLIDRVQLKFYKETPAVKYTPADNAALDIEFWPVRDLATNTPINNGDTSLIANRVKPGQEFFKWPVKFIRPDISPNTRYKWRVRTKCQAGDFRISPWSDIKVFNTPDFDLGTGIYTPPPGMLGNDDEVKIITQNGSLNIYPNPNHGDEININLANESGSSVMSYIQILDLNGKLVHAEVVAVKNGKMGTIIHFEPSLTAGMYFIAVEMNDEILRDKFVVK